MPSPVLKELFINYFGGEINGTEINEDLVHWVSLGTQKPVDKLSFVRKGKMYRALLVSEMTAFAGAPFLSLADVFGVSKTAMAIQLTDLGLVR